MFHQGRLAPRVSVGCSRGIQGPSPQGSKLDLWLPPPPLSPFLPTGSDSTEPNLLFLTFMLHLSFGPGMTPTTPSTLYFLRLHSP